MIAVLAALAIVRGSHAPLVLPPPPPSRPVVQIAPAVAAAWMRVATCETGGHNINGSVYSGMLGISNVNWIVYGGREFAPTAFLASFDQQVAVAIRIQGGAPVPDSTACAAW